MFSTWTVYLHTSKDHMWLVKTTQTTDRSQKASDTNMLFLPADSALHLIIQLLHSPAPASSYIHDRYFATDLKSQYMLLSAVYPAFKTYPHHYILSTISLYNYDLDCGTFTCNGVFFHCCICTFTEGSEYLFHHSWLQTKALLGGTLCLSIVLVPDMQVRRYII